MKLFFAQQFIFTKPNRLIYECVLKSSNCNSSPIQRLSFSFISNLHPFHSSYYKMVLNRFTALDNVYLQEGFLDKLITKRPPVGTTSNQL